MSTKDSKGKKGKGGSKSGKAGAGKRSGGKAPASTASRASINSEAAAAITDGRLQVAQAIELTSDLVSVNEGTGATDPEDLFTLSFDDPTVGINDQEAMRVFKANLKGLLPSISTEIEAKISTNPSQIIDKVADIVELLLEA